MRRLPNLLSIARGALAPFIGAAILKDNYERALWLTFIAGWTDCLDGLLARRLHVESRFGAYADPVADKILLVTVFVCLGVTGAAPVWFVALVLGRDVLILAMAAAALLFTEVRKFPPSIWGKLSTVVQLVTAVGMMTGRAGPIVWWMTAAAAVTTALSGVHYLWQGCIRPARSRRASTEAARPR